MGDLIDRQALLRQIDIDSEGEPGYYGDTWKFIDTIKRMPSALGTNLAEVSTDLISRQAAIDAFNTNVDELIVAGKENADSVEKYLNRVIDKIKELPSAQPETAKRIVGKSRDGMTLWYQCDMCNEPVDVQDNYCRGCGRRLTDG